MEAEQISSALEGNETLQYIKQLEEERTQLRSQIKDLAAQIQSMKVCTITIDWCCVCESTSGGKCIALAPVWRLKIEKEICCTCQRRIVPAKQLLVYVLFVWLSSFKISFYLYSGENVCYWSDNFIRNVLWCYLFILFLILKNLLV